MNNEENRIQIEGIEYLAIDLTKPLKVDSEVFPGDPKPIRKVFSDIKKTGFEHYLWSIGDHNFQPHADAPKHQNIGLQDRGIEYFNKTGYIFNKALLIDLSDSANSKIISGIKYLLEVTREELLPFKESLKKVGAVLIRTGYDKWIESNKKHSPKDIPHLKKDAVEFLASFDNLKVIGIDSLTIDPIGSSFAHHNLTNSKLVIESLVNLYKIPKQNINNFTLQTKPLVIVGATGGPIMVYAYIKV